MGCFHLLCSCGHLVTAAVSTQTQNDVTKRMATYRVHTLCPDCFLTQGGVLQSANLRTKLRALSGSAYQVAFANDIRNQHMSRFADLVREHPAGIADDMLAAMVHLVNEINRASWWIEHEINTFRPIIPKCHHSILSLVIRAAFQPQIQ